MQVNAAKNTYVFQVYYDGETKAGLDPHLIALDNSENRRPDWCEYWPIRWVLLSNQFNPGDLLSFLSPRFYEKTRCTGLDLLEIVDEIESDVYSFSPFLDQGVLFGNSFEQGNLAHPGLLDAALEIFRQLGLNFDVEKSVFDRYTTIFSNYFVARYEVWLEWLTIAEKIFGIVEQGEAEIGRRLAGMTLHRGQKQTPLKVFLMERLISVVLEQLSLRASLCLDTDRALRVSNPYWKRRINELIACDVLKSRYKNSNDERDIKAYELMRQQLFADFKSSMTLASNTA